MAFQLSKAERIDPLFVKLKAHMEQKLLTLRAMNDADSEPDATASLRGRIKEVKAFLSLDRDQPVIDP